MNQIDIDELLKDDDQHSVASMSTVAVPRLLQQATAVPQLMLPPVEAPPSPAPEPSLEPEVVSVASEASLPTTPAVPTAPTQSEMPVAAVASMAYYDMPVNPLILDEDQWAVMERLLQPSNRFLGSLTLAFSFLAPHRILVCDPQPHTCRSQGMHHTGVHMCVHAPFRAVT